MAAGVDVTIRAARRPRTLDSAFQVLRRANLGVAETRLRIESERRVRGDAVEIQDAGVTATNCGSASNCALKSGARTTSVTHNGIGD